MHLKATNSQRGSVLLVTLAFVVVVAIAITGYLQLVRSQAAFVSRSQSWNAALSLSEAGAEDGFALLNKNQMSFFTPAYAWTNNLTSDGWSALSSNVTSRTNYVGNNYYIVTITIPVGGGPPTIESEGYMQDNSLLFTSAGGGQPFFAAAGVSSSSGPVVVARRVRVPTTRTNLFNAGISAKNNITLSGGWTVDSFDSGDTNASTGGLYDAAKATDHAIVATDSTNSSCIGSAGSSKVKGFIKTGPGGTYSFGGNGAVGDSAWINGGNRGVQTGHYANDMNVYFPSVPAPNTAGWTMALKILTPVTYGATVTNYNWSLTGTVGNYQMATLSMASGENMAISGGQVNLYVIGNISVNGYIYIYPGSSLRLFCNGATATISGQGAINARGIAADFCYYGTTNNTSFSYTGQAAFAGSVYAPQAAVNMAGGSDYCGAIIGDSFTSSGNASFHVDEGLYRNGAGSPYIAASWVEVKAH